MKPLWLVLVLFLGVATDWVYRPALALGVASIDFPLLVILWLAISDRRPRIHLAVLFVALYRAWDDDVSLLIPWLPLASAAELMLGARTFVHLRSFYARTASLALLSFTAILIEAWMSSFAISFTLARSAAWGGVLASLSALLLFPILDAAKPLLRSVRYPL
ncbi:MAG: hypothetical protein L0Z55_10255 [Planctomycetes bacterium]|nr:hypothetical protein [Planctomycetota bacterium]